jgi:predicted TIM-barrel fold metal-dependent hydrolase
VAGRDQLKLVHGHHHLIAQEATAYPWIQRRVAVLEALLNNYYDIAHDYDVDDYLADVGDACLAASVACEFGAADPVDRLLCGFEELVDGLLAALDGLGAE